MDYRIDFINWCDHGEATPTRVILACIIVAFGLLYATHQGKGFARLLKDSRIELRRVTWPTKQETMTTSWQVLAVVVVASILLWCFDYILGWLMKFIIG